MRRHNRFKPLFTFQIDKILVCVYGFIAALVRVSGQLEPGSLKPIAAFLFVLVNLRLLQNPRVTFFKGFLILQQQKA